jgi:hypothetical protein
MKTVYTFLFLSAAVAGALFFLRPVGAASDPTNQLTALYSKMDSAVDHKDVDGCVAFHSATFLAINPNGQIETTDQQRSRLTRLFGSVGNLDVTTHIVRCDYADKTATVIVTQHIKTTLVDPNTGKEIPVSGDDRARECWTNGPGGWQVDLIQTLSAAQLTPTDPPAS